MSGAAASLAARLGDYVALAKPRITAMAVLMAAFALLIAPGPHDAAHAALALAGIGLVVGAANALNMWLERESDRLMERTRDRPLPDGRLQPAAGLVFGLALSLLALALIAWLQPLTALLALVALVNYVCVYTPLKRRTTAAVWIGAVSGAMPVLLGWTASTGAVEPLGLALFAVLFCWQVPHFLAISLFRQAEYDRAGIQVVPSTRGRGAARVQTIVGTFVLVGLSFTLGPLAGASWAYTGVAAAAGAAFLALALRRPDGELDAWARAYFHGSLVYLPLLVGALLVDVAAR